MSSSARPSLFRNSTNSASNSPNGSSTRVPQLMDTRERSSATSHHSPPLTAPGSVRFPWEPAQHNHQHDHNTVNAAGLHSAFAHHPFHAHHSSSPIQSSTTHSRSASKELAGGMTSGQHLSFDPNLPTGKDVLNTDAAADISGDGQHNDHLPSAGTGIPMSKSQSLGGLSYQSSATAGAPGILTSGTGKDFPRSRTSSTGHTTMIGPEFGYRRKVGFETFDGAKVKDDALFSYTLQVCLLVPGLSPLALVLRRVDRALALSRTSALTID